ncbi:HNH endonuclease [Sphingopyxis sp.]|uniref:HNH endonuclease n=1 Tax=Sphingopyxis sp. TaxID=1908224 RepID=UPI00311FFA87
MIIADLPQPVSAAKADWIAASTWLGFTPTGGASDARAKCQSTIQRQMAGGYVLEYITETAEKPNSGFERDPRYLEEQAVHQENRGRFLAVHKLRHSSRPLLQIVGEDEFSRLQDMWAQGGKRWRWSVAFPVIESYEIVGKPKANEVLDTASYRRLFAHSSATLRPLNDSERSQIGSLELRRVLAPNAWIAIEDEMAAALASEISGRSLALIDHDLGALEGESDERQAKIKRRAAWLADRYVRNRASSKTLFCDLCNFDPAVILNVEILKARTALDVHHKFPLEEGVRYTTLNDFALLCPTCHRMEHQLLKSGGSFFDQQKAPNLFAAEIP